MRMATTTTPRLRRPAGAAHAADRRREARLELALDPRRALGALRPRPRATDDRFLLSKGHGPTAYYAVLAAKGCIPVEELDGFGAFDSPLGHHPDRKLVPASRSRAARSATGSPIAVGAALDRAAACLLPRRRRRARRGQQLGGRAVRGPDRARPRSPRSSIDNHSLDVRLARRHRAAVRARRLDRACASTGATTTRSSARSAPRPASAPHVRRRGGAAMTTMRERFYELAARGARRRPARRDRLRRDRRRRDAASIRASSTSASASS